MAERPWRVLLRDFFGVGRATPPTGAYTVDRRRVFVLPTAQGFAFGATAGAILIGAINYANSLAYLVAFLLAGLGLVSALHAHRNLLGLTLRPARVEPVFAGGEALFRVCLEAPGPRPAVTVAWRRADTGTTRPRWHEVGAPLPGEGSVCVELPVPAPQRGRLALGRLRVGTRYPLGLVRAWSPLELDTICLVYPRPLGSLPLPAPSSTDPAPAPGARGPAEQDFAGLRDYVRGDSSRRIHWKAAARGRDLPVKLFAGDAGQEVVLRWAEAGTGGTEDRLSQLARWVLEAERAGLRYALELPGTSLASGLGEDHAERCLAALALYGAPPGTP